MGSKLCPKIILEGTRLTQKTELAFTLNEHPQLVGARQYRYHSPVVSGEWCGFTNTPWGRGLINFEPREAELALRTFDAWLNLWECLRYYSWIVDRFHLSTQAFQQRERRITLDFRELEARLDALGFHIVLCTRTRESFAAARERRLKISGNPSQYDNLEPFYAEQEQLRELAAASTLPVREFDVSDDDLDRVADEVAAWLTQTGGLYAKEPPDDDAAA